MFDDNDNFNENSFNDFGVGFNRLPSLKNLFLHFNSITTLNDEMLKVMTCGVATINTLISYTIDL